MSNTKIFIAEDDKWYAELLQYNLKLNPDYEVEIYETGKDLLKSLHKNPDVITLDYSLPDYGGDKLLKEVKSIKPNCQVVIISGQEDIKTAVNLLKEGAYDYLVKDDDTTNRLWKIIQNINETKSLKTEIENLKEEVVKKYTKSDLIVGQSPEIEKVHKLIEKGANNNITVSITGETGTGKELVAKSIHYQSDRRKKNFVAVNVTAIPKDLMESELFGHEKGAFTGASTRRIGKFEEANKGTLFLDEIGEMDLNMQSKLLRVLQERELVRVGGSSKIKLDVKLVVATHKDLLQEVTKGNFREDLYYRLLGLPIEVPALRDRRSDILILAKHFLNLYSKGNKAPKITFTEKATNKLLDYSYPGNVRELKAVIDLAAVMCDDNTIESTDINFRAIDKLSDLMSKELTLREYTHTIIKSFLEKYDDNVIKVAKKLDVGKSTIYRILKEEINN